MGLPGWEEFSAQLIKKAFPDYSVHMEVSVDYLLGRIN